MIVTINDKFRVSIDSYRNHQPEVYRESELIVNGPKKGQMSEPKWMPSGKYFKNLVQATHWGVVQGHLNLDTQIEEMSLSEHIKLLNDVYDKTFDIIHNRKYTIEN